MPCSQKHTPPHCFFVEKVQIQHTIQTIIHNLIFLPKKTIFRRNFLRTFGECLVGWLVNKQNKQSFDLQVKRRTSITSFLYKKIKLKEVLSFSVCIHVFGAEFKPYLLIYFVLT